MDKQACPIDPWRKIMSFDGTSPGGDGFLQLEKTVKEYKGCGKSAAFIIDGIVIVASILGFI